jgi:hypothetical protein
MTKFSRFIAPGIAAIAAGASLAAASMSPAAAGPKYVIHIPQQKPPIIHIPSSGGSNGGDDRPIIHIPKPRTPIVILDDGVGSGGPGPHTSHVVRTAPQSVQTAVDCSVKAPGGSTDNMWVINTGEAELAAGTSIRFRVRSTGDHGAFQLNRSIQPGGRLEIPHLLHGAANGAPCSVQILS